jgi:methyl-accepting chemotaxis protein/DNA-binding LacI/PurR family transcriptional regulator
VTLTSLSSRRPPARRRTRPTIGFTVLWGTDNNYIGPIWQGAIEAAEEYDVNLIAFTGRQGSMLRNGVAFGSAAFRQICPDNLDGMVAIASTLDEIRMLDGYGTLPIITISQANPECPSILADNRSGNRAATIHLIKDHHYQRIAFIHGPPNESDGPIRLKAYVDAVAECGLPADPQLIVAGDFSIESGVAAIRGLLERKVQFEAVMAANDNMALGAMGELQAQGLRVPYDVAVTGFDDSREASFASPPLTTVRQPQRDMGWRAIELALGKIRGENVPREVVMPTELMVRQSCGCFSEDVRQAGSAAGGSGDGRSSRLAALSPIRPRRTQAADEMNQLIDAREVGLDADWAEQLARAIQTDTSHSAETALLASVDKLSRQLIATDTPVGVLHAPLSALRRRTRSGGRAEDLWQQARVFLGEAAMRQQAQQRARAEAEDAVLRQFGEALITTFNVTELMDLIARDLPKLGIHSCYVALFGEPGEPPEYTDLILAQADDKRSRLETGGHRMLSRDLVPSELLPGRRFSLLVMPLHFRDESLGYVIFEVESPSRVGVVYEVLRSQMGSALKGALLFRERDRLIHHVADDARHVTATSAQLADAAAQAGAATKQIVGTMGQVAQGAQQQAESVSRTAAAVDAMARAIERMTADAQIGTQSAAQAADVARAGAKLVGANVAGMESIKARVGLAAQKVKEMGARSAQIGTIVETIDDIADQTNLLAVNATIEAARAGEQGKGFAVVATEVGKLAERSALATKEIGELIHSIQRTVTEAMAAMEGGDAEVTAGVERALASQKGLNQILEAAETVNQRVAEISAAASGMAAESVTVSEAIENIASVSEENSASSEEVSASSHGVDGQMEEVARLAQSLADTARGMHVLVTQYAPEER